MRQGRDPQPAPVAAVPEASGADALRAALSGLRGPRMQEPSVKATAGGLQTDRLLVTVPRRALYPGPRTRLARLLAALGAPGGVDLSPLWPGAVAVHFGAEGATRKCYLEFRDTPPAPGVVFHAVKWRGDRVRTDRYVDRAGAAGATIDAAVPHGPARAACHTLMARSAAADPAGRGFLLEVTGQDDARRSVDVNLAHCGLSVGDVADTLAPAIRAAGGAAGGDWVSAHAAAPLGHVAAGLGPDGAPFVTVYFGAGPA